MQKNDFMKFLMAGMLAAAAGCTSVEGPCTPYAACPGIEKTAPALVHKHAKKRKIICLTN